MSPAATDLHLRPGRPSDASAAYALWDASSRDLAERLGVVSSRGDAPEHALLEFVDSQVEGDWWVCEGDDELVGYVRVAHFEGMDEVADIAVSTEHQGLGIRRRLLERCWPGSPTPSRGRVVVTPGTPADLNLFTEFGVMPVAGHWYLRQRAETFVERRLTETLDAALEQVNLLKPERAVAEWKRLEPEAIAHGRPRLHEFFGRTRMCLASLDRDGVAKGLCWVGHAGEIGPAVGESAEDLIPVVLAALERVAQAREQEYVGVHCTSDTWYLLRRLRRLGFEVEWPAWIMSSVPLPGLSRYVPTRPARLL